jgi:methionyl-tRNA formyltransferase
MRVIFAGSPAIAVPSLEALSEEEGITLAGVLTNPDSPRGRSGTPQPTDIGEAAQRIKVKFEEQGREVFSIIKPYKLDAKTREKISLLKPDLLVSFAYGSIFGPKFLGLFPLGGINIHPSLLPKYRGPTPIQAAIINRDSVTGITVQKLALEMDSGDILATEEIQLTGTETTTSLSELVSGKAALMLSVVLRNIAAGKDRAVPQDHNKASFCSLISKDDGLIDWSLSAVEIEAKIRAFDPWPLCRTIHKGRELFILKGVLYKGSIEEQKDCLGLVLGTDKQGILIQTGEGILAVTELQFSGKKALVWQDFLNGARDFSGSILGV